MTSDSQTENQLRDILAEILVLNPKDISSTSRLVDDLDADSIAFLELNHRLKEDFGVEVPDPKVDEETLTMPVIDGLARLQARSGGVTLFDYLRDGSLNTDEDNEEARLVVEECVVDGLSDPAFVEAFLATMRSTSDPQGAEDVLALLSEMKTLPRAREAIVSIESQRGLWHDEVARLQAMVGREIGRPDRRSLMARWRSVFNDPSARLLLEQLTVGRLATLMRCPPPTDIPPTRKLSGLRLKDLFRFVTVANYVSYVRFLQAMQERQDAGGNEVIS